MYIWFDWINNIDVVRRSGIAFLLAFFFVIVFGRLFLYLVQKKSRFVQPIRDDGPAQHIEKIGTPTMGGVFVLISFYLSAYIWIADFNHFIRIIFIVSALFAFIGFCDDALKLFFKNSKGMSRKVRLLLAFIIAIVSMYYLLPLYPAEISRYIFFPYIHSTHVYLGTLGIILFGSFFIVGTSNSINLVDGLDGLAAMLVSTVLVFIFALLLIMLTPGIYSKFTYSSLLYYNQIREVLVVIAALSGALLAFVWYNGKPAKVFMGDVGALGVGAALAMILVVIKQEFFLALAGLIFVAESISVVIQVYYYKFTKKRFFLMAPLHHHFEKKGYHEVKIVKRLWLLTIIFSLLALLLLDLK